MSDQEGPILPEPEDFTGLTQDEIDYIKAQGPDPEPQPEPEPIEAEVYEADDPQCRGKKRDSGDRCRMMRLKGSDFCQWHQPGGLDLSKKKQAEIPKTAKFNKQAEKGPEEYGKLKPYPFHDGGVSENAAIRMISMVIPQCPIDGNPELKQKDGTYKPNPAYTGEPNCQQAYKLNNSGVWDVAKCEEFGHDPWHTTFRRPVMEEVLDSEGYVVETKTKYHVEKRLNVIQVSDNPRHTNRTEVALALAKGCKFLRDFDYESPCEFRNCTQPVTIDTRYGKYCSERHARLVAADFQRVMLPVGGDPYTEDQAREERESILANLNIRKGA